MSEKKIVVPLGMFEAFKNGRGHQAYGNFDADYQRGLEAVIRWWIKNPIIRAWQQRMFLAPDESEVPEELKEVVDGLNRNGDKNIADALLAAYRLGQTAEKK